MSGIGRREVHGMPFSVGARGGVVEAMRKVREEVWRALVAYVYGISALMTSSVGSDISSGIVSNHSCTITPSGWDRPATAIS